MAYDLLEQYGIRRDEDFTEEERLELASIREKASHRAKLVHQARQIIAMDEELTAAQVQGVRDRKRIRDLEKQLSEARSHGRFMGDQQIRLLLASDPKKLEKVFPNG